MRPADPREQDLDHLIAGLYDIAITPDLWTDWLASAAKCFGSNSGLALTQDKRSGAVDLLSAHRFSEHALRLYGEYYHKCDLWAQRSGKTLMKAAISADICSDEEFANSEIYVDLSKPHADNQFYMVGAVLPADDQVAVIGFQNSRNAGAFSRRHAQALDLLLPHLQRILKIRARVKVAESERSAAYTVLDSLSHGVLLVTRDARMIQVNQAAQAIANAHDGFFIGAKGILAAARPAQTSELHRLIAGCSLPAGGGVLSLPRPSGLRPFELIVTPIGSRGREEVALHATAMVFLRDPETQVRPLPEVLRGLYRLTPAEAVLAAELLANETLESIAASRRVSRETLRTQLKELFRKTGTRRQSELIGFLTAGVAVILPAQRIPPR
jgi:DNA-binding CsgD family transcriptional regulator/PAS domain-containing protein